MHGPNGGGVGRSIDEARAIFTALRGAVRESRWDVRSVGRARVAEGLAAGGNLTVLAHEALAGRLPSMAGRVLFLEDVSERVYRVDRMIAALADGGFFRELRAIVVGHFTRCDGNDQGRVVEDVFRELAARLDVPVVIGAPFGHDTPNDVFVQGARVLVTPTTVTQDFSVRA